MNKPFKRFCNIDRDSNEETSQSRIVEHHKLDNLTTIYFIHTAWASNWTITGVFGLASSSSIDFFNCLFCYHGSCFVVCLRIVKTWFFNKLCKCCLFDLLRPKWITMNFDFYNSIVRSDVIRGVIWSSWVVWH